MEERAPAQQTLIELARQDVRIQELARRVGETETSMGAFVQATRDERHKSSNEIQVKLGKIEEAGDRAHKELRAAMDKGFDDVHTRIDAVFADILSEARKGRSAGDPLVPMLVKALIQSVTVALGFAGAVVGLKHLGGL